VRYRIEVRETVSPRMAAAFAPLEAVPIPGGTLLVGEVEDQAGLFGALTRVRELGFHLVAVLPDPVSTPRG
jgi:hypothetical protein